MLLEVKNLKVNFHTYKGTVRAVDGISFSLAQGQTLCLVGESGSGKSVTALSLLKLIDEPGKIEDGEILLEGKNLLQLKEKEMEKIRGGSISMIFQDPMMSLNPSFTVGFQIKETLELHQNLSGNALEEKAMEALQTVAIASPKERLGSYPFELSGGMRQRVMIAMAMVCEPKILIADEPTTALDVTIQAQILHLIRNLQKKKNTAVLFITHDLGIVSEIADFIAVMYLGRIVESGLAEKILNKPLHPYTEGLLKSRPSHHEGNRKGRLYTIPEQIASPYKIPQGCAFWPRCPYAKKICQEKIPSLQEVENGHLSACWKAQGEIS